jgi:hypothetical protein
LSKGLGRCKPVKEFCVYERVLDVLMKDGEPQVGLRAITLTLVPLIVASLRLDGFEVEAATIAHTLRVKQRVRKES